MSASSPIHPPAAAPTLRGISSMATRLLLAELAQAWQASGGEPLLIESVGGVDAARRVAAGEPFDAVFLARDALQRLAADGHVCVDSIVDLVRSPVAVAVPAHAARPALDSAADVRAAVQQARRIGVSTGPSGQALQRLFDDWGLGELVRQRLVVPPPGVPVGSLVASEDIDLGFQQLSELIHIPGIQLVGTLPPELGLVTVFAGAVACRSPHGDAVRRVLAFMASPAADEAKRRQGMEPAR
ncbi:substrate-binding domain-containing protein [Tepidimonas aquatica]|uniref:Aconitate isomerase n=1 Tax=Tepidimonas aquatica TaxID=247482 RepID=A0A554WIU5_9BURK|nr:substrate-binding domain-containing protein [Tepidimonas aquatica]TSE23490.1 Aconitate isomerase [Tepidimonas aquatica]